MNRTVTIYGIRNCDTMKKARGWLDQHDVAFRFHDYKAAGAEPDLLRNWARQVGWEALLNRSGTTFRKLAENDKIGLDEVKALALMESNPSIIKRPVLEIDGVVAIGFSSDRYAELFARR